MTARAGVVATTMTTMKVTMTTGPAVAATATEAAGGSRPLNPDSPLVPRCTLLPQVWWVLVAIWRGAVTVCWLPDRFSPRLWPRSGPARTVGTPWIAGFGAVT